MGWEDEVFQLLEDLEGQAEVGFAAEREQEVAERSAMEYRDVTWASRVHGSLGAEASVRVEGVGVLSGTLAGAGSGWLLLESGQRSWLVCTSAVCWLSGLGRRSVPRAARGVAARLGLGSPLRRMAERGTQMQVHLRDGSVQRGQVSRVGADFCELRGEGGHEVVLPWQAVAVFASIEEWG